MYCSRCGVKIEDDSVFCSKCGNQLRGNPPVYNNQPNYVYVNQAKVPGNGLSIAGMVLGIIALFFAFCYIVALTGNDFKRDMLIYGRYGSQVTAYAFGVILIPTILATTGLPLSISGMSKHKSGKNVAGVVLNTITLVLQVIEFLYIVINYG